MYGCGKSDRPIVPGKLPNNGNGAPLLAEEVEGRGLTQGNSLQWNRSRTQRRGMETSMDNPKQARSGKPRTQPRVSTYPPSSDLQSPLQRIRQAACQEIASAILIPTDACASPPKVGAQCGSPARWDLCGGLLERAVPTATQADSACRLFVRSLDDVIDGDAGHVHQFGGLLR